MDPRVAAAAAAAWPGTTTLERFRRRVALELAIMEDGPAGPHSSLGARLSATLRTRAARLVEAASELCKPSNGHIRFQQLLAHGPNFENRSNKKNYYYTDARPQDVPGGAFLFCVNHEFDICVMLDVPALLKWHAIGSPMGPRTPHEHQGPYNSASLLLGAADGDAAATAPPPQPQTLSLQDLGLRAFSGPSAANELRRALVQRLCAARSDGEDGLPPYTVPWRLLAQLIAASRACTECPSLTSAVAFRAFLEHPASSGVFTATRIPRNRPGNNGVAPANGGGAAAGHVDCVTLSVPALRRAASNGLTAAIEAAFPGGAPMARLKRAAAQVLAAPRQDAMSAAAVPYSMNSGPLGNELIKREPLAYAAVRDADCRGLMSLLDEGRTAGYLVYVRLDGKEGCLQLQLHDMLMALPRDEGQDVGLGLRWTGSSGSNTWHQRSLPSPHAASAAEPEPGQIGAPAAGAACATAASECLSPCSPQRTAEDEVTDGNSGGSGCSVAGATSIDAAAPTSLINAGWQGLPVPVPVPVPAQQQHQLQHQGHEPQSAVRWAHGPQEFESLIQHYCSAGQVGVAAHCTSKGGGGSSGGKVEVVALYVPAAAVTETVAAAAAAGTNLAAATYLVNCTALLVGIVDPANAPAAAAAGVSCLRGLLENPDVVKVAHGCEQVAAIATCCGAATAAPMLDTRVLLRALLAMLPELPPPPPPAAESAGGGGYNFGAYTAFGPLAAVAQAKVAAHTAALRDSLAGTGLWADRPELLGALAGRHAAALREETFGVREWASNPAAHEAALVAAARQLPELWEAMTNEAVPWVAMAAAANAVESALAAAGAWR